jgi:MFS family permease
MLTIVKNKQIVWLFLSSFAILFTGMGLFPILPLYAAKFNASNSAVGTYFSIMYVASTLAPLVTGWLIARFSTRVVFVIGALLGLPSLAMIGMAHNFSLMVFHTSMVWFSGGIVLTVVSILTGLHTDEDSRGKAYSLMGMVTPLASLIGGASVGWLVAYQGYQVMFVALAAIWVAVPLIGMMGLKEVSRPKTEVTHPAAQAATPRLGRKFAEVLVISFFGTMAINVSRLGSSLSMQSMNFSPEAVSSAMMVAGLVAIPVTLAVGSFSDRLGRRQFMVISYLLAMTGALILSNAVHLWQFWMASILLLLAFSISGAMNQAVTGEVVPQRSLGKALAWMGTAGAAASIVCFALGGIMFDLLGLPTVYLIAALMALLSGAALETTGRKAQSAPAGRLAPIAQECSEA